MVEKHAGTWQWRDHIFFSNSLVTEDPSTETVGVI